MAKLRNYESEVTRLLRELLERYPRIIEEQARGRSMWWDRKVDLEEQRRLQESSVKQRAYVYD